MPAQDKIYWMSNATMMELNASIKDNLERYKTGDFQDLSEQPGWKQKELLEFDSSTLNAMSSTSSDELEDSLILFGQLNQLQPRLATCMNIWVPLVHGHLLEHLRKRWLNTGDNDEKIVNDIQTHVFKGGIGGYRDDNAAGRLWWTGYIGSHIARSNDPLKIRQAMTPFMRTTDTRSNVVERSGIFSERGLAKHISDYLAANKLEDSDKQQPFRNFMIAVNLRSNGRYFGDMTQGEVFSFLDTCR